MKYLIKLLIIILVLNIFTTDIFFWRVNRNLIRQRDLICNAYNDKFRDESDNYISFSVLYISVTDIYKTPYKQSIGLKLYGCDEKGHKYIIRED